VPENPERDVADEEVASLWADLAQRIVQERLRRVFLVGPPNAGKSTFCRVLLRTAISAGRSAELVDADLGQKLVGPPACVTLGCSMPDERIALSALAFVGTTDPVRGWRDLVRGMARLTEAGRGDLLVFNSGGLLSGPGRRLKMNKITAVAPDFLIAIGQASSLDAVLSIHADVPTVRLPSSPLARRKTLGDRRTARREAFRAYFAEAVERTFDMSQVHMEGTLGSNAIPPAQLLVGIADRLGRDIALGIVTAGDEKAGTIACLTPREIPAACRIRWGSLLLDENFHDRPAPP